MARTNIISLPTELHLQILSFLKPSYLFHTLRLVNIHFRKCVEALFQHDFLSRFEIELFPTVGDDSIRLVSIGFERAGDTGRTVRYGLQAVDQPHLQDKAIEALREGIKGRRETLPMRACLPPSYLITLRGKEWQDCVVEGAVDNSDQDKSGMLEMEWKKMVDVYFKSTDLFDDIADGTSGRGHVARPRFPMY